MTGEGNEDEKRGDERGTTTTEEHHPPPASRATARGVDRGWKDVTRTMTAPRTTATSCCSWGRMGCYVRYGCARGAGNASETETRGRAR